MSNRHCSLSNNTLLLPFLTLFIRLAFVQLSIYVDDGTAQAQRMPFSFRWLEEKPTNCYRKNDGSPQPQPQHREVPPSGCCQSLVCYRDRYLILFGGGSLSHYSNEVYVYDLNSRTWSRRQPENSDIVAPRLNHSAVIYKDTMIVYGGRALRDPVMHDEVLQLDLTTWRWSLLHRAPPYPDGPGARHLHRAHVIQDHMYVLLGTPFQGDEPPVWSLDLCSGVWQGVWPTVPSSSFPSSDYTFFSPDGQKQRLCGCCSAVYGDSVYIFGGYLVYEGESDYRHHTVTYTQTLYEFNAKHNTWRLVSPTRPFPLPPARYAASMAVHAGYAYIFGGDANQVGLAWYFNDAWRLHLHSGRAESDLRRCDGAWEHVDVAGIAPFPRSGCAYVHTRSSLYIVGGEVCPMGPLYQETFSNALYVLPLGYSCELTLRDNAARWLGLPTARGAWNSICPTLWPRVPFSLGARCALERYIDS